MQSPYYYWTKVKYVVLTLNAVKITRYIWIEIKISNIDYIIMINKTYNTKALSQLVGLEDTYKMK